MQVKKVKIPQICITFVKEDKGENMEKKQKISLNA